MPGLPLRSNATEAPGLLGSPVRNLTVGICFVLVVIALATVGYWLAGWPLGDAFYMVIVTVYTVGYGEVHPVDTPLLRGITISTIVLGCTGMIFVTGALVQFITLQHDEVGAARTQLLRQGDTEPAEAANDDMAIKFVDLRV
ncbi:MAG: potassium channel family protein, partial [Acetobacteraceae bacterium]